MEVRCYRNGLGYFTSKRVRHMAPDERGAQPLDDPKNYEMTAQLYLAFYHDHPDGCTLRVLPDGETVVEWNGETGYWQILRSGGDTDTLTQRALRYLADCVVYTRSDQLAPFNPVWSNAVELRRALLALLPMVPDLTGAHWIDGEAPDGLDPNALVAVRNGIFDVKNWKLHPHTPRWLISSGLNMMIDPTWLDDDPGELGDMLEKESLWVRTMRSVFNVNDPDDIGQMRLWQELTGYAVSARRDLETGMIVVGPPGSGKGTYYTAMQGLMGASGVGTFSALDMATQSGVRSLETLDLCRGRRVIFDPDVRVPDTTAQKRDLAKKMLGIVSNEEVTVAGLRKSAEAQRWGWFPVLMGNDQFSFPDPQGALALRFRYVRTRKGYRGQENGEDSTIKRRIVKGDERDLFGLWALLGLRRLIGQDWTFSHTQANVQMREEFAEANAPTETFVKTYIEPVPAPERGGDGTPEQQVLSERVAYLAFLLHAKDAGISDAKQTPFRLFRKRARSVMPAYACPTVRNDRRVRYRLPMPGGSTGPAGVTSDGPRTTATVFRWMRWKDGSKPELDDLMEVFDTLSAQEVTRMLGKEFTKAHLAFELDMETRPDAKRSE